MASAPTGEITLVFTDMEGSSARWERDIEGTRRLLILHDSAMREEIEASGGYEVKTAGDSFMVAFSEAEAALRFCLAAMRAMERVGVRVRIGAHRGRPLCAPDPVTGRMDYLGPVPNMAARLENAARPGQILVSDEARREGVGAWTDLGEHVLRGLEGRHRLWQLGEGEHPRPRTVDLRLTNLPARPDSFIGRDEELATLRDLFARGERLVTILGPGGAGKTRLSQRIAAEQLGETVDSAWFCDLSEARSLEGLVGAVANALDVPPSKDAVRQVGWAIAGRGKTMIVLDNFEQVIGHAAATVGQWVRAAPDATFLATSRIPLRLRGERTVPLASLPTADGVQLLVDRGFGVSATDPDAATLVERLDGLPLAIELAAARTRSMSVSEVLRLLGQRFRLLSGGAADLPDRHRALRATLDWSWELMTPDERLALGQLSVFEGGFTLEAAEEVLSVEGWPADVVQGLVEHSLVHRDKGAGRYHMLLSVTEYAAERLAEQGGRAAAEARHGAFFAGLGRPPRLDQHRRADSANRRALHLEKDNLVVACLRAVARGDAETATGTGAALTEILEMKGPFELGIKLSEAVLAMPALTRSQRAKATLTLWLFTLLRGNVDRPLDPLEALAAEARERADRRTAASALILLGQLRSNLGQADQALTHLEEAVHTARLAGDRHLEGGALTRLSTLHRSQGRYTESTETATAALIMHRETGDRRLEGATRANLAHIHLEQGRAPQALVAFQEALALHRDTDNRRSEGIVLANLGVVYRELGRWTEAADMLRAAMAAHQEVGNQSHVGIVLGNLADLYFTTGRFADAMRTYAEALDVHRQLDNRRSESITLCNLGELLMSLGQVELAQERFEAALDLSRQIGNRRVEGIALAQLGNAHREQGALDQARACCEEALVLQIEQKTGRARGVTLRILALTLAAQGDLAEARRAVSEAIELLQQSGDPQELAIALAASAEIAWRAAEAPRAREALLAAEALVEPTSLAGRDVARVRSLMATSRHSF